jgi:hypothetical protein
MKPISLFLVSYLLSSILGLLLFLSNSHNGSVGGPVIGCFNRAISTALAGIPLEFPDNTKTALSTTQPRVLYNC